MTKPPAKKAAAKKAPASAAPTPEGAPASGFSDKLLDELAADAKLAGVPATLTLHQLDRRRRARIVTQIAEMTPRMNQVEKLGKLAEGELDEAGLLETVASSGPMLDFIADVEDLLVALAVDGEEMRAWAQTADDRQLLAAFAQVVRSFSPGEASSSSI